MPWGARCSSCRPFCAIRPCSARQGSWRSQRARWTICSSRASAKVRWQRQRLVRYCTPVPRIAANRRCTKFRSLNKHYRKKRRLITFTVNMQEKKAEEPWSKYCDSPKKANILLTSSITPPTQASEWNPLNHKSKFRWCYVTLKQIS